MKIYLCIFIFIVVCKKTGLTQRTRKVSSSSPRIVDIKFLIDNERWKDYQKKYGQNPLPRITKEVRQLVDDASRHLVKLEKGGYKLRLLGPIERLEKSEFALGSTYKDRRSNNQTRRLIKHDLVGYAFTFQDTVSRMLARGWKTEPNIVRFILASAFPSSPSVKARPAAAAEEFCLCNPSTFPCIGILTETSNLPESVLLAHEIGHTLGAFPHDRDPGYIMSDPIQTKREYRWSPESRAQINAHNLDCLDRRRPREQTLPARPSGSAIRFPE